MCLQLPPSPVYKLRAPLYWGPLYPISNEAP